MTRFTRQAQVRWHGDRRESGKTLKDIGNTPLIEIRYDGCAPILAKAEYLNPTGSHKDRAYLMMVESGEACDRIRFGATLVDYTSGNGGASLAFIAREKGYQAIVVMPEDMTEERKTQIRSYGARLILTPAEHFIKGARAEAERIAQESPKNILLDQSDNLLNRVAFHDIGRELMAPIERALPRNGGQADLVLVGAIGTGASLSGLSNFLKRAYDTPDGCPVRTIGFEPIEAASSFAKKLGISFKAGSHGLIGTGPGKVAENTDLYRINQVMPLCQEEIAIGKALLAELEIPAGRTSAAAIYLARKMAKVLGGNGIVATVFYDAAWKYASEDDPA